MWPPPALKTAHTDPQCDLLSMLWPESGARRSSCASLQVNFEVVTESPHLTKSRDRLHAHLKPSLNSSNLSWPQCHKFFLHADSILLKSLFFRVDADIHSPIFNIPPQSKLDLSARVIRPEERSLHVLRTGERIPSTKFTIVCISG